MLSLGIFETINSNWPNHYGTVVKNRPNKVEVITFKDPLEKLEIKTEVEKRTIFNIWRFLKLR